MFYQSKWIIIFIFFSEFAAGQVGIGTTSPNAAAMLDITSTTKGMLFPRMTQAQKLAIASPPAGLVVYQTDATSGFWYYNGSSWMQMMPSSGGWSTSGNANTTDGTHFLGTTDNVPLSIRVNNYLSGRIDHTNQNLFLGYQAGLSNTGTANTFLGQWAGNINTSGGYNSAVGDGALGMNTTGNYNTSLGWSSLGAVSTGSGNTAVGYGAGFRGGVNSLTSGSNNTFIGYNSGFSQSTQRTNATAIGYNAIVDTSNALVLGSSGTNVGIGITKPAATLHVVGSVMIVDGNQGSGKVLTSDASGNASWTTPGGSSYRTLVTKSSDQVLNSISWTDVTGLSFSVTAGTKYRFYAMVVFTSTAATEGLNLAVNGPAAPTFLAYNIHQANSSSTEYNSFFQAYQNFAGVLNCINGNNIATIEGMVIPSANGTFTVQFAEENANKHTIKAGSTIEYW